MEPVREQFRTDADLLTPGYFKLLPPSSFSCKPRHTATSNEHVKLALQAKEFEDSNNSTQPVSRKQPGAKTNMSKEVSWLQEAPLSSTPKPRPASDAAIQVTTDPSIAWLQQNKVEQTANSRTPVSDRNNLSSSRKPEDHTEVPAICTTVNEKAVVSKQLQSQTHVQVEGKPAGKKIANEKLVLLSSGKQLHISSAEGTPKGKFQKHRPSCSGNGDQRGLEIPESLEHDNYYNFAASGMCAIATVKPEWEYEDETGKKQFERSLQETHVGKMNKHLEYYNTGFIKKKSTEADLKQLRSSHRSSPPVHVKQPHVQQKPVNSSHDRMLHSMPQPERKYQPSIRREVIQPHPQTTAVECQVQNGTEPLSKQMDPVVAPVSKVSSSKPTTQRPLNPPFPSRSRQALSTPERTSTKQTERRALLIANGAFASPPSLKDCQALTEEGHQQRSEPLNDLGEDGLNDLSEASGSSSSVGVGTSEVAVGVYTGGEPGTDSAVMNGEAFLGEKKSVVSVEDRLEHGAVQMDTRNDTAIAKLLQAEEDKQAGRLLTLPTSRYSKASNDYEIALKMQQECDAEMASHMQHEEREMAAGRSYGYTQRPHSSTYNEQTDRRNVLPYCHTPRDNNAPYHIRSRGSPSQRRRTEREYHGDGWHGGLGIVAAAHDPPRDALVQRHRTGREREGVGGVDMSYEALLELQDIPRGLDMKAIARLSTISEYTPAARSGSESGAENQKCCICLQDFESGQQLRSLPCIHSFHRHCIDKWLQQNRLCPVCQKDIQEMVS